MLALGGVVQSAPAVSSLGIASVLASYAKTGSKLLTQPWARGQLADGLRSIR